MAFSVERAMAKAAAALLPALLPTPASMITPSPCIIILPAASNPKFPKPGRADAAERWDAHKKPGGSPASSCGSTSSGRADSVERWDINKKRHSPISSSSSGSSSTQASSTSKNPGWAPSCERRWDSSKRPPSRANSAERWDAHKKPRAAAQADQEEIVDKEDEATSKKMMATVARTQPVFSGPSFVASPEPGMLPMPAFFPRRAGMIPRPAFVQAQ